MLTLVGNCNEIKSENCYQLNRNETAFLYNEISFFGETSKTFSSISCTKWIDLSLWNVFTNSTHFGSSKAIRECGTWWKLFRCYRGKRFQNRNFCAFVTVQPMKVYKDSKLWNLFRDYIAIERNLIENTMWLWWIDFVKKKWYCRYMNYFNVINVQRVYSQWIRIFNQEFLP